MWDSPLEVRVCSVVLVAANELADQQCSVVAGCLDEQTNSVNGGCWWLLEEWTSIIIGGCWLPGALLGAMWTTSLEAGAAVSCWRLQVVSGPAALRVVACCMGGRTNSVNSGCWRLLLEERTSSIVGGCWLLESLLGAMWATPLEAGVAVSCWRLQLVSRPAILPGATYHTEKKRETIISGPTGEATRAAQPQSVCY